MSCSRAIIFLHFFAFLMLCESAFAQSANALRHPDRFLRICSQNAHLLGATHGSSNSKTSLSTQALQLARRIAEAKCDIVALQEVGGRDKQEARGVLEQLADEIYKLTKRKFGSCIGDCFSQGMRNAFLAAADKGDSEECLSYWFRDVPKLEVLSPSRRFPRAPVGLVYALRAPAPLPVKRLMLINIHFKSKAKGWQDPTRTIYETRRMETAEGVRVIMEEELKRLGRDTVPILLGDRNSDRGSAASQILSGSRRLKDFMGLKMCRVDAKGIASCPPKMPELSPPLVGLFDTACDAQNGPPISGSYFYRGRWLALDEILVGAEKLSLFKRSEEELAIGYKGDTRYGSDHKLLWAEMQY